MYRQMILGEFQNKIRFDNVKKNLLNFKFSAAVDKNKCLNYHSHFTAYRPISQLLYIQEVQSNYQTG